MINQFRGNTLSKLNGITLMRVTFDGRDRERKNGRSHLDQVERSVPVSILLWGISPMFEKQLDNFIFSLGKKKNEGKNTFWSFSLGKKKNEDKYTFWSGLTLAAASWRGVNFQRSETFTVAPCLTKSSVTYTGPFIVVHNTLCLFKVKNRFVSIENQIHLIMPIWTGIV